MAADRPSHSSLSDVTWGDYETTEHTQTKLLMTGLTDRGPDHLLKLAKSWLSPAAASATGSGISGISYDPAQRAWVVRRIAGSPEAPIQVTLDASESSPLVNPAIVVQDWHGAARVLVAGHPEVNAMLKVAAEPVLEVQNLLIWCPLEDTARVQIRIEPARR